MYDNTSAGRDREMDVGSTPYDQTSVSTTATGTEYVSATYTGADPAPAGGQDSGDGVKEKATTAAKVGAQATAENARDVAQTAKEEARNVAGEVSEQARRVAGDVKEQIRGQARQQHGTMVTKLREASDEMRTMAQGRDQSPATSLVSNLAERTNRFADHLETRGPAGVLADVQEFARRRPGTFLLAAAAAGFVVGRLGKSVITAPNNPFSGDSGNGTGERDYRDAFQAGAADTAAGFTPAATTTATTAGSAPADTERLIRDDGGWNDPRPEAVGTGDDPGDPLGSDLRGSSTGGSSYEAGRP